MRKKYFVLKAFPHKNNTLKRRPLTSALDKRRFEDFLLNRWENSMGILLILLYMNE